jgi:hypothetical protein
MIVPYIPLFIFYCLIKYAPKTMYHWSIRLNTRMIYGQSTIGIPPKDVLCNPLNTSHSFLLPQSWIDPIKVFNY